MNHSLIIKYVDIHYIHHGFSDLPLGPMNTGRWNKGCVCMLYHSTDLNNNYYQSQHEVYYSPIHTAPG